jgi:hypothetical protein
MSDKELRAGSPILDLKDIPIEEWASFFDNLRASQFALSSRLYPQMEALTTSGNGYLWVWNHTKAKFKKNQPYPIGPAQVALLIPNLPPEDDLVLEVIVANVQELISIVEDFFTRPQELLELYNWKPYGEEPAAPSGGSGRTSYVAPITTTTFIATDGFEI